MNKKIMESREIIFRQGEEGDSFFQILRGSVMIVLDHDQPDELVLAVLEEGQFFGEMAVIEKYRRSATAVASPEGAEILEITSDETDAYLAEDPERSIELMKHLGRRLTELTESYEDVAALISQVCNDPDVGGNTTLAEKIRKNKRIRRSRQRSVDSEVNDAILLRRYGEHSKGFAKKVEEYPAGTVICTEGLIGNCLYDIHWGRVGIYRGYGTDEEIKLTELYPNTFFGEMGLINNAPRTATAVALEDTTLEVILEEDLKELFEKNPVKAGMIMAHLSKRLRGLTYQYESACELVCSILDAWDNDQPVTGELVEKVKDFYNKKIKV